MRLRHRQIRAARRPDLESLQRRAFRRLDHANPGIRIAEQRQTRRVPRGQSRGVQFHRDDALWSRWPLTEAVPGVVEINGRQGVQAQHAGLFRHGPFGSIRNMIPLPVRIQFAAVEVVVPNISGLGVLSESSVRLDPRVGRFAQVSRQTNQREPLGPGDRRQGSMRPPLP